MLVFYSFCNLVFKDFFYQIKEKRNTAIEEQTREVYDRKCEERFYNIWILKDEEPGYKNEIHKKNTANSSYPVRC